MEELSQEGFIGFIGGGAAARGIHSIIGGGAVTGGIHSMHRSRGCRRRDSNAQPFDLEPERPRTSRLRVGGLEGWELLSLTPHIRLRAGGWALKFLTAHEEGGGEQGDAGDEPKDHV